MESIKYANVTGKLVRATKGSVGFDLYATEEVVIPPQSHAVVGTGVYSEMEGCFAVLFDRSGLAAKLGVGRMAGLIDPDFDKEWKVIMHNFGGKEPFVIRKGDRIAQAVFFDFQQCWMRLSGVEHLQQERTDGFGSTGTN